MTAPVQCPQCGSSLQFKDGLRTLVTGEKVQRWLCRNCGFRFTESKVKVNVFTESSELLDARSNLTENMVSDRDVALQKGPDSSSFFLGENVGSHVSKPNVTIVGKALNTFRHYSSNHQICAQEAKNLEQATEQKSVASDRTDIKGKIVEYLYKMQRQGYAEATIGLNNTCLKVLMDRGANLAESETVKETIARQKWSPNRKRNVIVAYTSFLKFIAYPGSHHYATEHERFPSYPQSKK